MRTILILAVDIVCSADSLSGRREQQKQICLRAVNSVYRVNGIYRLQNLPAATAIIVHGVDKVDIQCVNHNLGPTRQCAQQTFRTSSGFNGCWTNNWGLIQSSLLWRAKRPAMFRNFLEETNWKESFESLSKIWPGNKRLQLNFPLVLPVAASWTTILTLLEIS